MVIQPSSDGRRRGGRSTWIGWAMDDACTDDILAWVAAGGPGIAEPPATLALQLVRPQRAARSGGRRRA